MKLNAHCKFVVYYLQYVSKKILDISAVTLASVLDKPSGFKIALNEQYIGTIRYVMSRCLVHHHYHYDQVVRPLCEHSCFHGLPPYMTILRLTIS